MPTLIRLSGPYGYVLALLALVVLFVTLRATRSLLTTSPPRPSVVREQQNALLFWGLVAAVTGFLGQCAGAHQALSAILAATEISPTVVAEGFVTSFVPTLFGLAILAFAVAAWASIRLLARGRPGLQGGVGTAALLLAFVGLLGCSSAPQGPGPEGLDDGVWVMAAGPDEFLWEFHQDSQGVSCMVHDIQAGRKVNETPCREAALDGTRVSVSMDTGVRLVADVDLGRRRLQGNLLYPDGSGREAELQWRPEDAYPALRALEGDGASYAYAPPQDRGDGWMVASAGEVGVDPQALEAMVASVVRGEAGILHSLLVARHGRLILEEYFHGYGPGDLHPLASCTKSVSSLLVGLAIQDGAIPDVHTPLAGFFPRDAGVLADGWDDLTLENLLTMSLALDWSPQEAQNLHGTGPDFFRRVLSRPVVGSPGRDFAYVNANVNLLAGVLRQATGTQAEAYAEQALFAPLGIHEWDWEGMKTEGYNLMDGSLRLLPRDMARIGQMVLDEGKWNGTQVVDPEWIRASTRRHLDAGPGGEGYGYLWWLMAAPVSGGEPVSAVFANGWGSQFIIVFPSLDLVVVTTGGNDYNGKHLALAGPLGRDLLPGVSPEAN